MPEHRIAFAFAVCMIAAVALALLEDLNCLLFLFLLCFYLGWILV